MLQAVQRSATAVDGRERDSPKRALPALTGAVLATGLFAVGVGARTGSLFSPELIVGPHNAPRYALPDYLEGRPENWQERSYSDDTPIAPHTADGPGLSAASTGVPTSFTIRLAGSGGDGHSNNTNRSDNAQAEEQAGNGATTRLADTETHGAPEIPEGEWDYNVDKKRFVYVWVAGEDSVFVAEVENNSDGTLTATYEASFPGDYLVHVEDVDLRIKGDDFRRGRPIIGSPFPLTVSGEPAVRVDDLPVCGSGSGSSSTGNGDGNRGEAELASEYWRAGSWVSWNLASPKHGVLRDGWVFQPKDCAYEAFSYEDLMVLASLKEPTWLLALGNSILRGVFLTLVDMALSKGQKDALSTSVLAKCWGFSDVRIGNLRLTYQDLRLYTVTSVEDATVCNDEKLTSGSTAAYVSAAKLFLKDTIFREGGDWPNVIWAPSNMIDSDEAPNLQISVLMDALPPSWQGNLVMMDHLYGYGYGWNTGNPTMSTLSGVKPVNEFSPQTPDSGVGRMAQYRQRDPRVSFVSAFPIYQARLFENENSRMGQRCYGCSIHYHYISDGPSSPDSYGGAKMVHSAVTETLANLIISKAVGTKVALYNKAATESPSSSAAAAEEKRRAEIETSFELCSDCPASLVPLHIKPVPRLQCDTTPALPGNASVGSAWDNELCPEWCMAAEPDRRVRIGSGFVDVRVCSSGP
eukprot:g13366.t1